MFFLVSACMLLACRPAKKQAGCDEFKTGRFFYIVRGTGHKVLVERNDSIQTETDQVNHLVMKQRFIWMDSCGYKLLFISESGLTEKRDPGMQFWIDSMRQYPLQTEILSFRDDYYIFETRTVLKDYVLKDTMWVQP